MGPEPRDLVSALSTRSSARALAGFMSLALVLSAVPGSTLAGPACSLTPQLRDVTINQGLGSYPKLVQGKETLVRAYLSLPSCASSTSAIRIVGGALTVRAGTLTNTVQAPFPAQLTPFPLISPNYRTTPPVDSPGDPKWVVPGSYLDPTGTAAFSASFTISVSYQSSTNGTTFGATQTVPFSAISKAVERETNPLRVLVVPVGNATLPYASQYSAAANEQVQLAMQTISRIFPVRDGTGELNATTGGVLFTVLPTLINVPFDTDNLFCLRGSSFDAPIKGQLQTFAQQWETENPGIQIDVAVAVIDPAISKGGSCAQGMAVQGSSYTSAAGLAVARMTPDQGGATLAMEIAHALGLARTGFGRAGDPSHSPVTSADAGSNRGYNVRDRSFLADDRTALYNSGTGFTNTSTLLEQLDYQFLLCALGGSTTTDCANPGLIGNNVPSGPRFVMSGTVAPDGLSVRNIVVAYSSNVPGTPPANSGPFTLRQINVVPDTNPPIGPPIETVLRTDFVRVSFSGTHHEDVHHADEAHEDGVIDVAVPFNSDADRIEFRNGTNVLESFVASEMPDLESFEVVQAGDGNYTQSSIDDASPTVSPDGEWVAWTRDPGGEDLSRIMIGPIEDSEDAVEMSEINAVLDGESQYDPAWRFDGGALAFVSDGDLYTIEVDTSSGTPTFSNLTFVVGYDEIDDTGLFTGHPTWSPDGSEIAFEADGAIFKISAEGAIGDEIQLTFTGDAGHPSWSQTDGDDRIAYQRNAPSEIGLGPTSTLASYVDPEQPDPPLVADITGTAGQAVLITAPSSVQPGALQDDSAVYSFNEGQVRLREPLSVDATANGVYDESADLVGGSLATDTIVDSHLLHFDPIAGATLTGTITFDRPVIGVIASPEALDNSDYRVGTIRSTAYVAGMGDRGPDLDNVDNDTFTINGSSLDFTLSEQSGIDEIRVITDCGIVCAEVGDGPAQVVNTDDGDPAGDDGVCDAAHCSLAEAIGAANASPDRTLITFAIPGSPPHTIAPTVNLPALGTGTIIDGDMGIELAGTAGADTGLTVSGSSTIREMVVNRFAIGVSLVGGSSRLEGNYIGTDPTGFVDLGNTTYGVVIQSAATGSVIGGIAAGERNVISGNGDTSSGVNVFVSGSVGNYIIGNFIGTDASGTVALANAGEGVHAGFAAGTIVGGSDPLAGNVIGGAIVGVESQQGSGTIVLGNSIGVALDNSPLGNVNSGVLVNNSPGARVGGTMAGASNRLENGGFAGVQVAQDGSGGALVAYNTISANATGVLVDGAFGVTVGDPDGFFGNAISGNSLNGVDVIGTESVRVLTNSIHDNGGIGIDLDADGVTPNESLTAVANQGQNTPVITSTNTAGDTLTISGTLDSQPSALHRLDFYANGACDPSLSGEGEGWLGSTEASTDATGHLDWSFDGDASIAADFGDVITATATDSAGNTSELSVCDSAIVASDLIVNTTDGNQLDDDGACDATHCSFAEAIDDANATPGDDSIGFDVPGTGPHNIALTDALPAITEAVVIDGTTEPDYTSSPVVTIDGFDAAEANGLEIATDGVTIRGLAIADFDGAGIVVNGSNIVIESNIIGGSEEGNGGPGVRLEVGAGIAVGGIAEGAGNEISWNGGDGVEVLVGADFNPIRGNSIHDNGGLGIDLGPIAGVTPNDPNDEFDNDSGGNDEMNFPRILSATFDGVDTLVTGDLDSEQALASPTIDLYENSNCDASGNGEGEAYLGSYTIPVGLDNNGHGDWSITVPGEDVSGMDLTATASDVTPQTSEFSACFTVAGTFTVNTKDDHHDPGGCTVSDCALREAIDRSNATSGVDTIVFDITGPTPHVIEVSSESPLPAITDPVVIDGTSEPDYLLGGPPVIELDGSAGDADTDHGLYVPSGGTTIRGLAIGGFGGVGIYLDGTDTTSDGNTIADNYIGVDAATGAEDRGVAFDGVAILSSSDNEIKGNVISGNGGNGVAIRPGVGGSDGNWLHDNFIGTTADGTAALGNDGDGVLIDEALNTSVGPSNVIAANGASGVEVHGTIGQPNDVFGNHIGTNEDGVPGLGNAGNGIHLDNADFTTVGEDTILESGLQANVIVDNGAAGILVDNGASNNTIVANVIGVLPIGPDPATLPNNGDGILVIEGTGTDIGGDNTSVQAGNLIGGNVGSGIRLQDASGTNIRGNAIGTGVLGVSELGNGGAGIDVGPNVSATDIGGTSAGVANYIAFNGGDGVVVNTSSNEITIQGNSIDQNEGLGIDLDGDGVTANDEVALDGDPGANSLQNFPRLTVASGGTSINGVLRSEESDPYEIQLYVSAACDASGFGEGDQFVDSVDVTTNASGYAFFSVDVDPVSDTDRFTATATDSDGNTSEFSACAQPEVIGEQVWTLDPTDPAGTELLVADGSQPSWGTGGEIAFTRDNNIFTIGSDEQGGTPTQLTDLGLDSMPSLGSVPAFVRFVDDFDGGGQDDAFLLRGEFDVSVTATDDYPDDVRLDLIYSCPGSPNYDVAVGLAPQDVVDQSASWAVNFDASLACPNGTLSPRLTDFWNRTAPTGFDRQIASLPQPPVAAIYVPEVGDTLLQWNALALHGSGKDADDGELLGSSLRWFINGQEVDDADCGATHSHCDIQPPGGSWMPSTGPNSIPLTVRLDVTDSDGDTHSDEVTIQVLRDFDEDGMPATVEQTCGLSDANARDAFTDRDGDLYLNQNDYALGGSPCVAATSYPADVVFSPDTLYIPSVGSAVTMNVRLPLRDIKTVRASSVRLQLLSGEVVAIPNTGWTVDKSGVGIAKFDRQVVIRKLQQLGMTNTTVHYTIIGTSTQGWSFEGTDTAEAKPAN